MSQALLDKSCDIYTEEWLINWTSENLTGREKYPEPVYADGNAFLSPEVSNLRDAYLHMRRIYPGIRTPTFRWEQIDTWNVGVKLCSNPGTIFGGRRAQYTPKVSGLVVLIGGPLFDLKWMVPMNVLLWVCARHAVEAVGGRVLVNGANAIMIVYSVLGIMLVAFLCHEAWFIHKSRRVL